jgi:hypothetical protein
MPKMTKIKVALRAVVFYKIDPPSADLNFSPAFSGIHFKI